MTEQELLWNQYQQNVDLFKFYMELILKLQTFHYAITGAIFSFYFSQTGDGDLKYSLFLPLLMSIGLAAFFVYGATLIRVTRQQTFDIRDALGLDAAPDLGVLAVLLYIFSTILVLVAVACGYILWCK